MNRKLVNLIRFPSFRKNQINSIFFSSDSFPEPPLRSNNEKVQLQKPFSLNDWIEKHREDFRQRPSISLFPEGFQTRVYMLSKGPHTIHNSTGDVWLWQHVCI